MKDKDYSHAERRHFVRHKSPRESETVVIEKRKYLRLDFKEKFDFTICTHEVQHALADSRDISQFGILFTSPVEPQKNAIISIKIAPETINQCLDFGSVLHEKNGEMLAKVIRVSKNESAETFDIAAAFLKKGL
jgi:hypothetical protein